MSERKDKTPGQVSDENYKVAPARADEKHLNKRHESAGDTQNYRLPGETMRAAGPQSRLLTKKLY